MPHMLKQAAKDGALCPMVSMLTILLLVTLTEQYSCLLYFPN